jgi:hypothetical protein
MPSSSPDVPPAPRDAADGRAPPRARTPTLRVLRRLATLLLVCGAIALGGWLGFLVGSWARQAGGPFLLGARVLTTVGMILGGLAAFAATGIRTGLSARRRLKARAAPPAAARRTGRAANR